MNTTEGMQARVAAVARKPFVRRGAIAILVLIVLFGLIGYFVLPGLIKSKVESLVEEKLGRKLGIEAIEISPYSLEATVRGLKLSERDGTTPFVAFDALHVNVQAESIFRLAPVVREVKLSRPYVHLVREDGTRFNFSDIIELINSQPPSDEPARFSVNNIAIEDGRIEFDDRPEKIVHTVSELQIGLPFVSNLPSHVEVFVEPLLSASINGASLHIVGKARPFHDTIEASVDLDHEGIDLARLATYIPFEPRFKLPSAKLDLHINASFVQPKDMAPRLIVKGTTTLKALELTELDGKPLIKLPQLDLALSQADVFAAQVDVGRIALAAPEIDVLRRKDGGINLMALAPPPAGEKAASGGQSANDANKPASKQALQLRVGEIVVDRGVVRFSDEVPAKPFRTVVDRLDVALRKVSLPGSEPASVEVTVHTEAGETIRHGGEFTLQPLAANGEVELDGVQLSRYVPHYVPVFAGEVEKGALGAKARYAFSMPEGQVRLSINDAALTLADLALRLPGEKRSVVGIETLAVSQTTVDLAKRQVQVGDVSSKNARFAVVRGKDGAINLAHFLAKPAAPPAGSPVEAPAADKPDAPFVVGVSRVALERWSARIEDQTMSPAIVTTIDPLSLQVADYSTETGNRAKIDLKAQVNKKGQLAASGTAGAAPLHANLKLDVKGVDLLPGQPYFTDKVNVLLTSAALTTRGTLALDQAKEGTLKGGFRGEFAINDLATVDKTNSNDFLKWRSLFFGGVEAKLSPFALSIDQIALSDYYSRIILSQDGRLNLQDVMRGADGEARSVTDAAVPAGDTTGQAEQAGRPAGKPAEAAPAASASPSQPMPPIRIGKLVLQGGHVNFTDNFIKPNYTADLKELGGSVTGLSSDASTTADVDLRGQVNNAPLNIVGKVNPLSGELALDLKADVKGMELAPLSPYSGKYVGYGIEKGKLSFDVNYKIHNRKLTAENRLVLDQLTFGEKIDSPTATKLPVQLAVALLRDRNGVIDINLPIGGSLDDPQFSVGGIIVKVLINVITKAITAPFALLGSLFGGGEELSHVDFDAGLATIAPAGEGKLKSLAKALADRPALKLEITGRVDPETDREGLRRASIDRKVRALKLNDLVKKGESVDPASIAVAPEEYPVLLKRVYKDEKFPKPRNAVGLTKDLPVEEMEKLMITNAQVSDDDMVGLGNQRAQVVKDWLLKNGGVAQDRVFLLAAKVGGSPAKAGATEEGKEAKPESGKAKASRVDFSLK